MPTTTDLNFLAANIVFQIGDLLEAPVAKRQETNDTAIAFVERLVAKYISQHKNN
jgi:hypothetical protein